MADTKYLIECKRHKSTHKIGVAIVRALLGIKQHEKATKAFLVTTSSFTRGAKQLFQDHRFEIEGRDYTGIREWVVAASRNPSGSLRLWPPAKGTADSEPNTDSPFGEMRCITFLDSLGRLGLPTNVRGEFRTSKRVFVICEGLMQDVLAVYTEVAFEAQIARAEKDLPKKLKLIERLGLK